MIIARSLSELVAIREEIEPLLIINNSHYLLDDAVNNYITVKNIITAAVSTNKQISWRRHLFASNRSVFSLPPEVLIIRMYAVKAGNRSPGQICAQLVAQHHITADEAQRIIAREGEGAR